MSESQINQKDDLNSQKGHGSYVFLETTQGVIEQNYGAGAEYYERMGLPKEHSGWDVYNNEARKVDTELVKDWTSSLNSLLIFVSFWSGADRLSHHV